MLFTTDLTTSTVTSSIATSSIAPTFASAALTAAQPTKRVECARHLDHLDHRRRSLLDPSDFTGALQVCGSAPPLPVCWA